MIKEINDLNIINSFLKYFNIKLESVGVYSHYLIYETNDKNIAFLVYDLIYDRLEIEYIYVDIEYRNQGIASKMLDQVIKIGKDTNCHNVSLEVRESNLAAIKFYKKHKFIEVAKREKYYKNEDGILMVRELV